MNRPVRHAIVIGGGIGGLMCALALSRRNIATTLYERDAAPPSDATVANSLAWLRRGVPQALHPHFFMGRLRVLLETSYPDLVDALARAGAGEGAFEDYVHPIGRAHYRPRRSDAKLKSINCRRTTFEMTVRDYVRALPDVRIVDSARVVRLVTEPPQADRPIVVTGVEVEHTGSTIAQSADVVIDAGGRFERVTDTLASLGAPMQIEQRDSSIWYFTRHYRLLPGCDYPDSYGVPGAMFPDFIVGALPADNGAFTVTFQIYREDKGIAKALRDPAHFQAMCSAVQRIAPWVDPARAEPTTEVFGFGQMDSFWRRTVVRGRPTVLGFFCVGDSAVRSNPKFGRGCTWTTVAAHHLADLLAENLSADERVRRYERTLWREFRADWRTMQSIDRSTERQFEIATGRRIATLADRISLRFAAFLDEAMLTEPGVFREIWTGYHGFARMSAWSRKPGVWLKLARAAITRPAHRDALAPLARRPTREALAG